MIIYHAAKGEGLSHVNVLQNVFHLCIASRPAAIMFEQTHAVAYGGW